MANVAALKKKAIDFESKKQFEKAIAAYREVLDAYDRGDDEEPDIALYNRVGDLLARQGNNPEAVSLYERAVDLYTEGGFFNNAIALCNKVLRTSPGRASIYYKLGKISAAKGFKGEAKQNFLEYADRMQKNGQMDEAFRALKEFADLVPDQDDVRLMLAEQLTRAGKGAEALEQLQELYHRHETAGRTAEMQATLDRMKAIDPTFEPAANEGPTETRSDDLIFIDLDTPPKRGTRATQRVSTVPPRVSTATPPPRASSAPRVTPPPPVAPPPPPPPEPEPAEPEPAEPAAEMESLAPASLPESPVLEETDAPSEPDIVAEPLLSEASPEADDTELPRIEITSAAVEGADDATEGSQSLLGLEPTSFLDAGSDESEPMDAQEFDEINLDAIEEARTAPVLGRKDLALGGDLPPLAAEDSLELPRVEITDTPVGGDLSLLDADEGTSLGVEPTALDAGVGSDSGLELLGDIDDRSLKPAQTTGEIETVPDEPGHFGEIVDEVVDEPPPPVRRSSSLLAANSVLTLRVKVEDAPEDWGLHRQLGEALLDTGEREEGMKELETALAGFDKANDIDSASSIADEIVRIDPSSVRYHQKRVEYAFRANDKGRTADAYLALADALLRNGQTDRARTVYQRILELVPAHAGALAALESFLPAPEPARAAPAPRPSAHSTAKQRYTGAVRPVEPGAGKRYTGAVESVMSGTQEDGSGAEGDDFVSLGDWLRADAGPKSLRMVVEEQEPTGDEQADFADMLKKFKQGISENVEDEDHESHYDLGVAYKEMGLVDEAIAEFQKALRGTQNRARTYEALGQCFIEKKQLAVATTILKRALSEPGVGDEQLVGVLYLLGYLFEAQSKPAEAKTYYERVFGVDIQFRDVGDRLNAVDKALR